QTLKGDLEDKAKFLSSLVGDANLKGQIEATRTASSANTQTLVQLILMLTSSICSAALYDRPKAVSPGESSCHPRIPPDDGPTCAIRAASRHAGRAVAGSDQQG
ncbi:MAG: hypothetical protein ACJ8AW_11815, partial [Rhodopila sp.]